MIRIITATLLAALIIVFSVQNLAVVPVSVGGLTISISLFAIVIGALLAGVAISLILGAPLFQISSKKLNPLEQAHQSIDELYKRIISLQDENARLRTDNGRMETSDGYNRDTKEIEKEERQKRPFIERITH